MKKKGVHYNIGCVIVIMGWCLGLNMNKSFNCKKEIEVIILKKSISNRDRTAPFLQNR